MTFHIDRFDLDRFVADTLAEDLGDDGDITSAAVIPDEARFTGIMRSREPIVVAGLPIAEAFFRALDPEVEIERGVDEGGHAGTGDILLRLRGLARAMLTAERSALNSVQHMSGIATLTRRYVDAAGGQITVLDTRKTTPTLRALEKYAVRAGGGSNHRSGLDDGILIKDNHVRLAGGVATAVHRMRQSNQTLPVEVEAQSLCEVDAALDAGADIVLLDNLSTADIIEAVAKCRGKARTEISGGVTLARMPELATTGADYVSIGALTHSAPAADLSFEIEMGL